MALDPQKQFALLVGLNKYPAIKRDLKGPKRDLEEFSSWLKTEVGLPADNIIEWTDKPTKYRDPKAGDFLAWLLDLDDNAKQLKGGNPKWDRLYLFFAGHGYNATTGQQSMVLPMTTPTTWDTVPMVPLRESLRLRAYFREIIVVFDACRDVLGYATDGAWLDKPEMDLTASAVKVFSSFASKTGRQALEVDFGGSKAGVLTQAFLTGMKGYAADANGVIYANALRGFIFAAVKDKLGADFEPDVDDATDPNDPPWELFRTKRKLPKLRIQPKAGSTGMVSLRKGDNVVKIDLSAGAQVFEVPYGYYTLTEVNGTERRIIAAWEEKIVEV